MRRCVVFFFLFLTGCTRREVAPVTLTTDGAWCWFSDPRAVYQDGLIHVGWITSHGDIRVGAFTPTGEKTADTRLFSTGPDDHANPALLTLPDGRLAAFFAPRAPSGGLLMSVSTGAPRAIQWSSARRLPVAPTASTPHFAGYANPVRLPSENNRLCLFWRGMDYKPMFSTSDDDGGHWAPARAFLFEPGQRIVNRPYIKVRDDGRGAMHFAFTNAHPREGPPNDLFYLHYEKGNFSRANGTTVGHWEDLPLAPSAADRIYAGESAGPCWVWDVASDKEGRPVIAYARFPKSDDHRYHYARWDGKGWVDVEVTAGGRWFPNTPPGQREEEPYYSGGMAIDPAHPNVLYLSRPINGRHEIEQWSTPDGGQTWKTRAVTKNSKRNNVRPVVVGGAPPGATLLAWMSVTSYRDFKEYASAIAFTTVPLP